MSHLFEGCSSLIELPDISNWDTNSVLDINYLFNGCSSLKRLPDITKWDMKNVKDISSLFCFCSSLISLPDISKWKLGDKIKINNIFKGCDSLLIIPDISKWSINFPKDMKISSSDTSSEIIETNKNDSYSSEDNLGYNNFSEDSSSLEVNNHIAAFSKNNENEDYYDNFYN